MDQPDRTLDLTDQICPMTFVRTRLALDAMQPGQTLLILLQGEEPQARVPRTIRELGHAVLSATSIGQGGLALLVRKQAAPPQP